MWRGEMVEKGDMIEWSWLMSMEEKVVNERDVLCWWGMCV